MQRTRSVLKTEAEEKEGRKCKGRSREKVSTAPAEWEDDVKSCKTSISHCQCHSPPSVTRLPTFFFNPRKHGIRALQVSALSTKFTPGLGDR